MFVRCRLTQAAPSAEERFWSTVSLPQPLPRHVAICMDGCRRWAVKHRLPLRNAYLQAAAATESTIASCRAIGLDALTLFAFSSDNWERDPVEVALLTRLFEEKLKGSWQKWLEQNLRITFLGHLGRFSSEAQELARRVQTASAKNRGLSVNWAVSYGGRDDLVASIRAIALLVAQGDLDPSEISDVHLRSSLQSQKAFGEIGDPDLLIRTSGEQRLSNFLIWDVAYTELYFDDVLWPDFDQASLLKALRDYSRRERRYGR